MTRCTPLSAILAALLLWRAVEAGVAQTLHERLEGKVSLEAEHLRVGGRSVEWKDVLYLLADSEPLALRAPEAVRLARGELWRVHLDGLSAGKLKVRSSLFGGIEIDAREISWLEFSPSRRAGGSPGTVSRTGCLYKTGGKRIPGQLLWIDRERVAIASPLGVLKIPREDLDRYVFPGSPVAPAGSASGTAPAENVDEVALVDGSIFRGSLRIAGGNLALQHPRLGQLSFPPSALRSVVRHWASVIDLTELVPASVKTYPLISGPIRDDGLENVRGDGGSGMRFIKGLKIQPKTVVQYSLKGVAARPRTFRALLGMAGGSRGSAHLRIRAGDAVLCDRPVEASSTESISLTIPPADTLTVEADFGKLLRFPCQVLLGDPRLQVEGGGS